MTDAQPPKLFISYSWSTQDHEAWVMALATELRESGVDVILDKWDLKDGHDSIQFMESMVTDESVTKVIMVSDKIYAQKADGRAGGVGTETQIISAKVYEKAKQDKFVAVVAEKEDGRACLPTFYGKRKYIDLSEAEDYAKNFEMLLRWIFDKPLHVKPEIGAIPAFLSESTAVNLGTSASLRRALDAIKQGKTFAAGAVDEYFRAVSQGFEKIRIEKENGKEFDDQFIESIQAFIPYRNEIVSLIIAISQYDALPSMGQKIHRFLESLLPYADRPAHVNQYRESDFDNFKFLINEIFLYVFASLIKYSKFELAQILISTPYYIHERTRNGQSAVFGYSVFYEYVRTLDYRNQRLRLGRLSLAADLLKDRSQSADLDFNQLMQADLILFLRGTQTGERWFPNTLLYANRSYGPFEVFARSISQKYFDSLKPLIGVADKRELGALLLNYKGAQSQLPRWQFDTFDPEVLVGFDKLGTRP